MSPSIELIAVVADEAYMEPTLKAIRKSLSVFNRFDDVKIICPQKAHTAHEFSSMFADFTFDNYSEFMVKELVTCVGADFCMTIQWDSCIIDASKWTEEFLNFHYVGAVWQNPFINRVGNGGCALRHKKFLKESSKLNYIKTDNPIANNEDIVSCVLNYDKMTAAGVRFAPISLARKFSVERPILESPHDYDDLSTYNSFAFHGQFNNAGFKYINT